MSGNPFAQFAAGSTNAADDGGWFTTRRPGRDDGAIRNAARKAEEVRKNKNRRGGGGGKGRGGGGGAKKKGGARGGRRRASSSSSESDVSFDDDDDDEDDFIVQSDDEESVQGSDDEDVWDSELEDEDDSFDGKKKKLKKEGGSKSKAKVGKKKKKTAAAVTGGARGARAATRNNNKWKPSSINSGQYNDVEELDEETPPRGRVNGPRRVKQSKPVVLDGDSDDGESEDDIYKQDDNVSSPEVQEVTKAKATTSKYFIQNKKNDSDTEEEEKKEDDVVATTLSIKTTNGRKNGGAKKRRGVFDDSDDSDGDLAAANSKRNHDNLEDSDDDVGLNDTPAKPSKQQISAEDYVSDDDEAVALAAAVKESLKEDTRKRLKKKTKTQKSSLEAIGIVKKAKAKKVSPVYKVDSDEDKESDNVPGDEDEDDIYAVVDEEEQTAAQVLKEANALSSKIVKIVGEWCGGEGQAKGLIVGEGAMSFGGGGKSKGISQGNVIDQWISNETMKEIMPSVDLAEYQLLGVNWMALLNRLTFGSGKGKKRGNKIGGMNVNGILADEMGLGKTVQTIAFLAWLNYQNGGFIGKGANSPIELDDDDDDVLIEDTTPQPTSERRPHLIVVPASVLSNWMNEFKKFAPHMNVVKYYGTQNERQEIQEDMRRWLPGSKVKDPLDVVLTTFSYFSSEKGDDRSFLRKFKFDYLVVDEGHTLKNPKGLRYKNLNKFSSTHRLLLTGTPVQNSPKELMSLLCFLMPLFDTKAKSSKRKGEYDDDGDGNDGGERMLEYFVHLEGGGAGSDETAYRKLKQLFAPFVLRRKKDDVLSQIMPPKTRKVELVPMDEATQSTYDSILANHVKSKASIDFVKQKHLFTELRKAANHPLLLRTRHLDEADTDKLAHMLMKYGYFGYEDSLTLKKVTEELEKFSDYDVHCAAVTLIEENPERQPHLEQYTLLVDDLFCSPKFVRLRTLLPELVGKGHRILLFSQWTRVLDLMHNLLESLDMKFMRLDGSTAVNERQEMIDTFTEDSSIPIFLLSTRAGGMGLNLTAADVCILHDLDFNPFNDRQAEDRCHRIGQKKPVTILKMVTRGTVDEAIYSLQERKERMNEAIMDEKGAKKKNDDNEAIVEIMKGAVDQYLKSPKKASAKASSATKSETIEII